MTVLLAPAARHLGTWEANTPEWDAARASRIGGSTIAAILGISPWESPYSVWCRMAGLVDKGKQTKEMARGHYLEPGIRAWFADQHPEFEVHTAGTYVNVLRDYQLGNPDALCARDGVVVEGAEFKTDANAGESGWGRPGTAEIPRYYMAQIQWYMDVFGLARWRIVVLDGRLSFREYVIDYDAALAKAMRDAAEDFLASLFWDEMPELDDHVATYEAVLRLHPEIHPKGHLEEAYVAAEEEAVEFIEATLDLEHAEKRAQAAKTRLAASMGKARRALYQGYRLGHRQLSSAGNPFLMPAPTKNLSKIPLPQREAA
ncbi:lambda-exonuclease family protein [Sphaerisporangium sp. NPDC004334]